MVRLVSQDNNVILLDHRSRKNNLSDHDKIVFAHHYFESGNHDEAIKLLSSVSSGYYISGFHKDIARALLCQSTYKLTLDPDLGKESEFYLVVYNLTIHIVSNKINFVGSGHFYQLRDELFRGWVM
jgi:hypothetical protein